MEIDFAHKYNPSLITQFGIDHLILELIHAKYTKTEADMSFILFHKMSNFCEFSVVADEVMIIL